MNKAKEFFESLPLDLNGIWRSSEDRLEETGNQKNSGVQVGNDGGPCLAKLGRYHIFSNKNSEKLVRWIVDTHTKEIRRIDNSTLKLQILKENLAP
ncbi:hypothetical protein MUB15_06060 [Priestia sp. OVS21]|nr:hypothetical protein [Priestia sp. OVS21]